MPKVSVIIPYFKGQAYLEECVQSIEEQKIEDLEIIVVNDKDGHEVPDSVKENPHVKVFLAMDELPEDVIRANEETAAAWREQKIHERVEKRLDSAERRREQPGKWRKKEIPSASTQIKNCIRERKICSMSMKKKSDRYIRLVFLSAVTSV